MSSSCGRSSRLTIFLGVDSCCMVIEQEQEERLMSQERRWLVTDIEPGFNSRTELAQDQDSAHIPEWEEGGPRPPPPPPLLSFVLRTSQGIRSVSEFIGINDKVLCELHAEMTGLQRSWVAMMYFATAGKRGRRKQRSPLEKHKGKGHRLLWHGWTEST